MEQIARGKQDMTTVHGGEDASDWFTKEGWSSSSTACCMTGSGLHLQSAWGKPRQAMVVVAWRDERHE
jgi:hypothetical protein